MAQNHGATAECLLAVLGFADFDNDAEHARAMAGAIRIAEALHDLKLARMALCKQS